MIMIEHFWCVRQRGAGKKVNIISVLFHVRQEEEQEGWGRALGQPINIYE